MIFPTGRVSTPFHDLEQRSGTPRLDSPAVRKNTPSYLPLGSREEARNELVLEGDIDLWRRVAVRGRETEWKGEGRREMGGR
ncbi:hypothetical protein E2C01_052271 [Portunus trituberculatus]|uniref:Uncharacterized protein n=1 Tax=Portunus trituberculatus TaxID=210409 RepID=A0A5B7GLH7_PORTR|nr:hypothetical protein [Portunus trituberculatus]